MVLDWTGSAGPAEIRAGSKGLFWFDAAAPEFDGTHTLVYLDNRASAPVRLPAFPSEAIPTECGGRFYWLEPVLNGRTPNAEQYAAIRSRLMNGTASQSLAQPFVFRLMSAPKDLHTTTEEARIVVRGTMMAPVGGPYWNRPWLFSHNRSLFLLCYGSIGLADSRGQAGAEAAPRDGELAPTVFQVVGQTGPRVTRIAAFPKGTRMFYTDQDSIYGVLDEERENWLDWSRQGMAPTFVKVVYRFRLPD
jgi:hypothetical protein